MHKRLKKVVHLLPKAVREKMKSPVFRAQFALNGMKLRVLSPRWASDYHDENRLYWISPHKIEYRTENELNVFTNKGKVIGGNWDALTHKFNDIEFYESFWRHMHEGMKWCNLPYYQNALRKINEGEIRWGCKNEQELDERCRYLDNLFMEIKEHGYKNQTGMGQTEKLENRPRHPEDEIAVNIGRHGDLLFNNGRHRLTFAKIAGVEKIPVRITVRHYEWEAFKQSIIKYAQDHNGKVYAPLTHIDLTSIPSHYSDTRFRVISQNIGRNNGTILDIGANWGYFCHKFEEEGHICTAVENDERSLYFLRKLHRAENRRFTIHAGSIFNYFEQGSHRFDVVLTLAVFHHFLKTESEFNRFRKLLNDIDAGEMYFEPHSIDEPQMRNAYKNFTNEEFVQFIIENSCLNHARIIGRCEDGRPLYKLWR